jgi:hypothetical protein
LKSAWTNAGFRTFTTMKKQAAEPIRRSCS